ncbi:hypothetical protein BUALT_Bualt15G0131200 [Buddleja alternifolia]|uniref:Uncharacterized protein n=1 Tax=Buddleja alternifolia TaxID=168488 RepID=A0AAV6WNV2_9LAMI|nr:hypothetical protein BUALT_Bualt15G0131200 [Buddleja alternifolia]
MDRKGMSGTTKGTRVKKEEPTHLESRFRTLEVQSICMKLTNWTLHKERPILVGMKVAMVILYHYKWECFSTRPHEIVVAWVQEFYASCARKMNGLIEQGVYKVKIRIPTKNVAMQNNNKRDIALGAVASSSWRKIDVEYLESEFKVDGVSFSSISDSCVARLSLENGSSASLMLPSGLITSFKSRMWHGATMELLHTCVSAPEDGATAAVIQGGLSLALGCENDDGDSWSPNHWVLHKVNATPQESIQVELISRNVQGNVEVKHIITLGQDYLSSEIVVSNSSTTTSLHLRGSIISHLAVSTPDATYALGLERSQYFIRPPFVANFTIIPPDFYKRTDQEPGKFWAFNKLFSKWDVKNRNDDDFVELKEELEGEEEEDNYKHLTAKLSRIYNDAPRNLTIMDRGRRNSVRVRRNGFNEVYMLSPGSEHEWYDKYSYICIGHAALLQPIILNAQSQWRGALQLLNPNS